MLSQVEFGLKLSYVSRLYVVKSTGLTDLKARLKHSSYQLKCRRIGMTTKALHSGALSLSYNNDEARDHLRDTLDGSFGFENGRATIFENAPNAEDFYKLSLALIAATAFSLSIPDISRADVLEYGVSQQPVIEYSASELKAKLEAQIKLDFKSDLEVQAGAVPKEAPSLLELAEHFEEIDSKVPSDAAMNSMSAGQLPSIGNPEILPTSFAAPGLALSGASIAESAISSAIASTTSQGLSARLATILAEGVQHFAGGGLAGAIGASVVYPLDTVKTKMQAQKKGEEGEEMYENEIDCIVKLVKKGGIGSLYSGMGPQLLGIAPEKAMKLTVNEMLVQILEAFLPGSRLWFLEIFAGGGGGLSQVLFTNPVETVKVKLQTQKGVQKSPIELVRELGLKGLYHGSTATILREVPGSAVFFVCYTLMKQAYPDQFFMDGCLAAIPAAIIVTPADVLKTKLTVGPPTGEEPYKGAIDCVKRVTEKDGIGALFNGWATRALRIGPQFGITLMVYDMLYHK